MLAVSENLILDTEPAHPDGLLVGVTTGGDEAMEVFGVEVLRAAVQDVPGVMSIGDRSVLMKSEQLTSEVRLMSKLCSLFYPPSGSRGHRYRPRSTCGLGADGENRADVHRISVHRPSGTMQQRCGVAVDAR